MAKTRQRKHKPIAYRTQYLNDTEKKYSIGELELLAVVWGLEKIPFCSYGKKVHVYTDHQALEPLLKKPEQQTIQREINEMARPPNAF